MSVSWRRVVYWRKCCWIHSIRSTSRFSSSWRGRKTRCLLWGTDRRQEAVKCGVQVTERELHHAGGDHLLKPLALGLVVEVDAAHQVVSWGKQTGRRSAVMRITIYGIIWSEVDLSVFTFPCLPVENLRCTSMASRGRSAVTPSQGSQFNDEMFHSLQTRYKIKLVTSSTFVSLYHPNEIHCSQFARWCETLNLTWCQI